LLGPSYAEEMAGTGREVGGAVFDSKADARSIRY
jgi:hypothetical protein